MTDKHGYPTDGELRKVAKWDFKDKNEWFEYIASLWNDTYGKFESERIGEESYRYTLVTGGWSGNESVIRAMHKNILWTVCWEKSERGGLYVFKAAQ